MTTQSYLTDMQTSQQVQQISNSQQVQSNISQKVLPVHTVIQPSQATYNGQQFIVTITGDQNGEHETIPIPHGASGQVIYQPQQSYSDYSNQGSMYTSVTGAYYQSQGGTPQMSSGIGGIQGQIITHGGESYLVHGSVLEGDGQGLSHNIRASPASDSCGQRTSHFDVKCWQRESVVLGFKILCPVVRSISSFIPFRPIIHNCMALFTPTLMVQWLMDNYETAEGVSLPRGTLYCHYLQHCQEHKLEPMNPASFGKLIRSVFLGLRTRRLGTRGNSQYHYYGIRIKSTSQLNHLSGDHFLVSRQNSMNPAKRFRSSYDSRESSSSMTDGSPASQPPLSIPTTQQQHQQFLGDASAAMPEFGHINLLPEQLPPGLNQKYLLVFEELYRDHCEAFLEIIVNLHFHLVETLWMSFWKNGQADPECEEMEQRLPKEKLFALCELPAVRQYVLESDYAFYQALIQVLIPDVLRPIPGSLTQAIRNFAKSLESWLKNSMCGVPDEMIKIKVNAVSAFAQILRRYTSLNHLAQAARAVLQNSAQIGQMLADINKVDFSNVQEQASWVCQCDDDTVRQLEEDFKKTLQHQTSLEQWASWLEDVVNQALSPHEASPDFAKAARQFLLKWSFYSSMVIRDLTLRSAASFGSFHLIRLLYDEYMFYLVEHKVAAATGETSIAVMGKVRQLHDSENWLSCTSLTNGDLVTHHQRADQMINRTPGGVLLTKVGNCEGQASKPTNVANNLAQSSSLSLASTPHPAVATQFQDSVISTMSSGAGFFLQPLVTSACHHQPPQRASLMTISDSSAQANKTADMMPLSAVDSGSGMLVNGQTFVKLARTS